MKHEIVHVDVWSVMKIAFLLCGVSGFIFGLFYAIFLSIMGGVLDMVGGGEFDEISGLFSGAFGFFMAFFLAFTYAVVGSIMSAIIAWLYNLFARIVGGVKFTLEPESGQQGRSLSADPTPPSVPSPDHPERSPER